MTRLQEPDSVELKLVLSEPDLASIKKLCRKRKISFAHFVACAIHHAGQHLHATAESPGVLEAVLGAGTKYSRARISNELSDALKTLTLDLTLSRAHTAGFVTIAHYRQLNSKGV